MNINSFNEALMRNQNLKNVWKEQIKFRTKDQKGLCKKTTFRLN